MRAALFILLMSASFGAFAQSDFSNVSVIMPLSRDSVHYQIKKGDVFEINISIREPNRKIWKLGTWGLAAVPSMTNGQNKESQHVPDRRRLPVNIGFLSPLAALHLFNKNKRPKTYVDIKQYTIEGKLLSSSRAFANRRGLIHVSRNIEQDGFLTVSIENFGRRTISARSAATNKTAYTPKDTVIVGEGEPIAPDAEEPIAWENYLDGVTINGKGTFANADFLASYEAAFGPSETWIAVASASGGEGGGGGGDGGYEPASAEAKKEARDLKKIAANRCEAEYILDHATSEPTILPKLITTKAYVEAYMNNHNMPNANTNGAAPENAFKHALYNARTFCEIGYQHANALANLHETCNDVNQNPSEAERIMDNFNNQEGFKIAASVGCSNPIALETAVMNAYINGKLHKIDGTPTP